MHKIKILQVINSLYSGGAEKLLVETTRTMASLGHEVDVLLLHNEETHLTRSLVKIEGVRVLTGYKNKSLYNPFWAFTLHKIFRQNNYAAIQVHLFPALYWAGIAQLMSKKKHILIYTEHNTTNRRRNILIFKFIDALIYKQYTTLITISDSVDSSLKKYLGNSFKRIFKVYNGINLKEINSAEPYDNEHLNLPKDSKIVIQVSSFTAQKDQQTLIRGIGLLNNSYHLLLVGDGPTREACELLAQKLNLNHRVHFLGIRSDVPRLLKSADFVVLSSHYEGLSLASVEGMASGNPFLASDVPGLREVVINAGLLFEDGDYEALAGHILSLSSNKHHHLEIVKKCQKRAKKFDINVMVSQYIELYKEAQMH